MKKLLSLISILLTVFFARAQDNNPYNEIGLDGASSIKMITDDYKGGKIENFDDKTIEYYSSKIPLKTDIKPSPEMISAILYARKNPDFDILKAIDNLSGSDFYKTTVKEMWFIQKSAEEKSEILKNLSLKVETINKAEISNEEREKLLSLISILYNVNQNDTMETKSLNNQVIRKELIGFGVMIGFVLGAPWGPGGQLIGCIIGGVVGALC